MNSLVEEVEEIPEETEKVVSDDVEVRYLDENYKMIGRKLKI